MGARDGVTIDERQELLEHIKERPAGQDADALLGLDGLAPHRPLVHHTEEAEPLALLLTQVLPGVLLIELDGSTVSLREGDKIIPEPIL